MEKNKVIEMFESGLNPKQIAEALQVSLTTVYKYIDVKKYKRELKKKIYKAHKSGMPPKQIAAEYSIHLMSVYRYLKERRGKSKPNSDC